MNKISKYSLTASTALLLALGTMSLRVAADPESFSGAATLCAISPEVIAPPEQKGNNGVLVKNDMTFIYLIKADNSESLMNGWEDQTNNSKLTKSGVEFFWGRAEFIPDGLAGTGALVEDFKYKSEEIASGVSGTFTGTGVLEGVTVDYALSPPYAGLAVDFPSECYGYVTLCGDCSPAFVPIDPNDPSPDFPDDFTFYQYDISGWIEGYQP
jgi:hypothetical protein